MPTSIRLPDELDRRLTELARATGRTKVYYIKAALNEYLDDLEDIHLAQKRIEDLRAGRSETYSLEEMGRELGLGK